MTRKKLKITIECEGNPTQVLEANGIAAALLTDGNDADHHGLKIVLCGHMCTQDLIHLHEAVGGELIENVESMIINNLDTKDLLKMMLRGKLNES